MAVKESLWGMFPVIISHQVVAKLAFCLYVRLEYSRTRQK